MSKVSVPVAYLSSTELAPAAKLLYSLVLLQRPIALEELATQVNLSERTVRRYLSDLRGHGLSMTEQQAEDGETVTLNGDFLKDRSWPVSTRYLYMLMLAHSSSSWCFLSLRKLVQQSGLAFETVSDGLKALREARIVETFNDKLHLIRDPIPNLANELQQEMVKYIHEGRPTRPGVIDSKGERLLKTWLDIYVAHRYYSDNVPFLSGHLEYALEIDRLYLSSPPVAIEFNGPHHYDATAHETPEGFAAQQYRDRLKQEMCDQTGTKLITVHPSDLHPNRIVALVRDYLPLRQAKYINRDDVILLLQQSIHYLGEAFPWPEYEHLAENVSITANGGPVGG